MQWKYLTRHSLVAASLIAASMYSFGQSTSQVYSFDVPITSQTTVNSCTTAEPVVLNGSVHFEYTFTTDSNGVNYFKITPSNSLKGLGQNTGNAYTVSDSNTYTVTSDDSSATLNVDLQSDLTPEGSGVLLTLVQTLKITVDTSGNISGEVTQNATQCAN